jgi:hypothetical protein
MKKIAVIFTLMIAVSLVSFAKDIHAWKNEKNLEQQYFVFKENLNFWSGSYFLKEEQLDQFYGALKDTIAKLDNQVVEKSNKITSLQNELKTQKALTNETQVKLDKSVKLQDSITVLGMDIKKGVYTFSMYAFILGVLFLAGIVFMLYKRSNTVTVRTKKEYKELKEEFEAHKKYALDRYTKMNMELHKTRMELNKR